MSDMSSLFTNYYSCVHFVSSASEIGRNMY